MAELPPRTRRILTIPTGMENPNGTTSAHAENTSVLPKKPHDPRNYLRARGEYTPSPPRQIPPRELPPRTRRILTKFCAPRGAVGTTSAHAENTSIGVISLDGGGNYLRARGEYRFMLRHYPRWSELPPRTRRIRGWGFTMATSHGTTSAHAENTSTRILLSVTPRNYLRARGEYAWFREGIIDNPELPPRTRRILFPGSPSKRSRGTTSAHAENTRHQDAICAVCRNYLRARGEYSDSLIPRPHSMELPPRTRRILCTNH